MPMMTTKLFSSRATKPEASIRGVTNRCTGLMPSTSIASISSRIVRDPKSAHIAVAAGARHDQHRHQRADLGDRAERGTRAGQVSGAQFAQQDVEGEADQDGERNSHQQRRRHRDARDKPRLLQEFAPLEGPDEHELDRIRRHREQAADRLHGLGAASQRNARSPTL